MRPFTVPGILPIQGSIDEEAVMDEKTTKKDEKPQIIITPLEAKEADKGVVSEPQTALMNPKTVPQASFNAYE